jgi:hypothetical protein
MGFRAGCEVFPDLGYIADHPANAWVRATASHNTVLIDRRSVQATGACELAAFVTAQDRCFVDLSVPVRYADGAADSIAHFRRALLALAGQQGIEVLVDVFDAEGAATFDYVCRAGSPGEEAQFDGLSWQRRQQSLFAENWPAAPWDERTAGASDGFSVRWPSVVPIAACVVSPSEEVMRFQSPAWRSQSDVFDAPKRAWTAMVCRQRGPHARFVTVFCLAGPVADVHLRSLEPTVSLEIRSGGSGWNVDIGPASADVERVDG